MKKKYQREETTMNPEDYVSYPIALALKKHGFDLAVNHYYDEKGDLVESLADYNNEDSFNSQETAYDDFNHGYCDEISCSAPTLAQAQKWLREKWGLIILVGMTRIDDWFYGIYDKKGKCLKDDGAQRDCYESALSAGIAAALELIEKKGE